MCRNMIKTAYIVEDNDKASVLIEHSIMKSFDDSETAALWAFSLGYRVYKKSVLHGKDFWVKYTPSFHKG